MTATAFPNLSSLSVSHYDDPSEEAKARALACRVLLSAAGPQLKHMRLFVQWPGKELEVLGCCRSLTHLTLSPYYDEEDPEDGWKGKGHRLQESCVSSCQGLQPRAEI